MPKYGRFSDPVKAIIKATYSYGGPVKGEVTLAVHPRYKSSSLQPFFLEPVRKTLE